MNFIVEAERGASEPKIGWSGAKRSGAVSGSYRKTTERSGARSGRSRIENGVGSRSCRNRLDPQICTKYQMPCLLFTLNHIMQQPNKLPSNGNKVGDKFRSIFSDNLQPIATRGKKAPSTLLVDQHCGNG